MLVEEFDFELPERLIAQQAVERGTSRLLNLEGEGRHRHVHIGTLASILNPGDLLVVNNTRVLPARLFGRRRPGGGRIELLLAEQLDKTIWEVLLKPGKRSRPGTRFDLMKDPSSSTPEEDSGMSGEVLGSAEDGRFRIRFSSPIEPHLDRIGHVPLPPYIKRQDSDEDRRRYQTVYAEAPGAIAAPTAGLHFTEEQLELLAKRGIDTAPVTLHVGLGTFKPVTARLVHEHTMDREQYDIPAQTLAQIEATKKRGGRIVAVGTTVVRTLEGAAAASALQPGPGSTQLFITPGFRFQVVDALLTNFHLPCSTLLMLVCAFSGQEKVLAAYQEAVAHNYRFYSYGDAMFVARSE